MYVIPLSLSPSPVDLLTSFKVLGASEFSSTDRDGVIETVNISYWRTLDDIHTFAYGPLHREAWQWWDKSVKGFEHIGINHEIFAADPHHWEAIYVNFQPTLLGATTYLKKGDKLVGGVVEDQYVGALVDARKGPLRTSAGRLGWEPTFNREKFGQVVASEEKV